MQDKEDKLLMSTNIIYLENVMDNSKNVEQLYLHLRVSYVFYYVYYRCQYFETIGTYVYICMYVRIPQKYRSAP